jgi:hypothetical protein
LLRRSENDLEPRCIPHFVDPSRRHGTQREKFDRDPSDRDKLFG